MRRVNSYDVDGVIWLGPDVVGVYPGPDDVIVTGRSFEEQPETERMMSERGIRNTVFYNPLRRVSKTRLTSGVHKAATIIRLRAGGTEVVAHFEDDPVQAEVIGQECPWVKVIMVDNGGLFPLEGK